MAYCRLLLTCMYLHVNFSFLLSRTITLHYLLKSTDRTGNMPLKLSHDTVLQTQYILLTSEYVNCASEDDSDNLQLYSLFLVEKISCLSGSKFCVILEICL